MAKAARVRVDVKPALLRWARDRAGMQLDDLTRRFPRLARWESGEARPTRRQLERFAKATHATVDHLLLAKPPVERVPIPDFRAAGTGRIRRPSPNLLDTLSLCRQRQAWYRNFARVGDKPLTFVGSANLKSDIAATAAAMRSALGLDLEERQKISAWDKTLRRLIDHADALGILVMVNGVVGNNSYRRLDPQEFRGFALADARAPLVFINGADAKASARFLAGILGLPEPSKVYHFEVVTTANGVSVDFADTEDEIRTQHYAFLVSEEEFDAIFSRIRDRGLVYWADPARTKPGEINHHDSGRGVYFGDPSGHLLEIITRPYGSAGG